jgi:hypothetical protein
MPEALYKRVAGRSAGTKERFGLRRHLRQRRPRLASGKLSDTPGPCLMVLGARSLSPWRLLDGSFVAAPPLCEGLRLRLARAHSRRNAIALASSAVTCSVCSSLSGSFPSRRSYTNQDFQEQDLTALHLVQDAPDKILWTKRGNVIAGGCLGLIWLPPWRFFSIVASNGQVEVEP